MTFINRFDKHKNLLRVALLLFAVLLFFLILRLFDPFSGYAEMTAASNLKFQLALSVIFIIPAFWLIFFTKTNRIELLFALVISGCVLFLRMGFFENKTMDHQYHLDIWLKHFSENGGFQALKNPVGNYNLPYLYLISLASYVSKSYIFLKFLALPFEFMAAIFAFKITDLKSKSFFTSFLCYSLVLCLPTLVLNNSYWGQCDVIFTSFIIGSLYFLLTKRNFWAMIFWGLAFSLKMQAFFIAPLFFVLLLHGNLRLKDFLGVPISYLLIHIPGVLIGYPLQRVFNVYFGQMAEVETSRDFIVINAPNVYHFFTQNLETRYATFSLWGIMLVMISMLLLGFYAYHQRAEEWSGKQILILAVFISSFVPYFLPGMEDRVFFMADLISILAIFWCRKMLWPAVLINFSSWMAYSYFLYGEYWVDFRILAAANAVALILIGTLIKQTFSAQSTELEEADYERE